MSRSYFVSGVDVLVSPDWSIKDQINARSTLSINVVDALNATITESATFQLYDGATKIFEGVILRVKKVEEMPGYLTYNLEVVDNSAIADKRRIAKVYENELAGDIVKDIITEVLGVEGITEGNIEDGPTISKAVFNYVKCSEALDYIKEISGLNWNIDKDKQLNLFDRATNTSPWSLSDSVQHYGFEEESNMDEYRNTQYIRGGKGKTSTQSNEIPTPKPDSSSRNFVVRFPVAEKPTIEINLNGGGWVAVNSSDIGVNGLDQNKKWYYAVGSNVITQDSGETVLSSVDSIRITYIGLRNLFAKVESLSEITTRASTENNSGIYEDIVIETSLNESDQALEYGTGLLALYGQIKNTISFVTEVSGLEAGQLLSVDKPLFGINDSYLIESVSILPVDTETIEYSINALSGKAVGGWEKFFKDLIKTAKSTPSEENEVLITLNNQSENQGYEGENYMYITTRIDITPLVPSTSLYPSKTLYPTPPTRVIFDSEVTLDD